MKNLIEYRFSCENLFFKYLKKQITLEELVLGLRLVESIVRNELNDIDKTDKGLWFRFGKYDILATTISDVEKDLANSNRQFRLEEMERVIGLDPNNELEIYFS